MTDCGCERAKLELDEYLHDELGADEARTIREHLDGCRDCETELEVGRSLVAALKRGCREKAPDAFREQVLSAVRDMCARHAEADAEAAPAAIAATGERAEQAQIV